jgi:molybdenum cofactor cytidylyltransferase
MKIVGILLAAGLSRRFGEADKLFALVDGTPLVWHAARRMMDLTLHARYVVGRRADAQWPGLTFIQNNDPEAGMGHSVRLGVQAAMRDQADALLLMLGDMPFVPLAHLHRIMARADGPATLVASTDGVRRTPPALFGAQWFPQLEASQGDKGGRDLLIGAHVIAATPESLLDIDAPGDIPGRSGVC